MSTMDDNILSPDEPEDGFDIWAVLNLEQPTPAEHIAWLQNQLNLAGERICSLENELERQRHSVPLPTNADEAEALEKIGFHWLAKNAPDRLTDAGRTCALENAKAST